MSFLKAYTDYAGRLTDAPPLFHMWTGIGLLAGTLGNGCWVYSWGRRICPNVWVVLLADSGILRKSTSLIIGQRVFRDRLADLVWPSEWSFEGLVQTMAAKPAGVLFLREFKRFNAALMRDYASGAKELLVDTYDNPEFDSRHTKKEGEVSIRFPAPSILAATTMDWFEASLQRDDVGGGFLSRMFLVPADERGSWKGLGSTRSDADNVVRESLGEHLERVRETMQGELDYSQIKDPFNKWLRAYEESWVPRCSAELAGTISRSGANALKLATIFQADLSPSTKLTPKALERAIKVVEFANDQTARLLAEGLGLSREANERKRVAAAIQRTYPDSLAHSDLLKNSHLDAQTLERHIKTLVQTHEVEIQPVKTATQEGKAYRWRNGANPS